MPQPQPRGCSSVPMATTSTAARRLSDLLTEQQEHDDDDDDSATPAAPARTTRNLLRGRNTAAATVTKLALRWADDLLAGCFSPRRLPCPDRDIIRCGRQQQQLSPVSVLVLDLHSDDESSALPSHRDEHTDDDDGNGNKPSTSGTGTGTSPSPDHDLRGKTPSSATEDKFQNKSVVDCESIAADIFRIPWLLLLFDLSASPRDDWRRLVAGGGEEEARQVARSLEAMIFEEVRWEAVRDMLSLLRY